MKITSVEKFENVGFIIFAGELLNAGICISGIRPASGGVNLPKWTSSGYWVLGANPGF